MSAAHTPGPWFTGHRGTEELWVGPGHQSLFVCTVAWECDDSRSNARANARLIAAAPELLEALIECHHELEGLKKARDSDYARPDDTTIEQAGAAIAKATGSAS